jgi:excisionase family DNA binding protein
MHEPITVERRPAYSIVETADLLRCSRSFVYKLIESGHLHRIKIGTRSLINSDSIDRLLEAGTE